MDTYYDIMRGMTLHKFTYGRRGNYQKMKFKNSNFPNACLIYFL